MSLASEILTALSVLRKVEQKKITGKEGGGFAAEIKPDTKKSGSKIGRLSWQNELFADLDTKKATLRWRSILARTEGLLAPSLALALRAIVAGAPIF